MRSALHNNSPSYDGSYPEVVFGDFATETVGVRGGVCRRFGQMTG